MLFDVVIPTKNIHDVNPVMLDILVRNPSVNMVNVTTKRPLSMARKHAVLQASTKWVAMFDADILIEPRWFEVMQQQMGKNVGAVSCTAFQTDLDYEAYVTIVRRLLHQDHSTHINNVLIRRSVMEDFTPLTTFFGEDQMLKQHLHRKGLEWRVVNASLAGHMGEQTGGYRLGYAYGYYRIYEWLNILQRFMVRLVVIPFTCLITRTWRSMWKLFRNQVRFTAGWLQAQWHR